MGASIDNLACEALTCHHDPCSWRILHYGRDTMPLWRKRWSQEVGDPLFKNVKWVGDDDNLKSA